MRRRSRIARTRAATLAALTAVGVVAGVAWAHGGDTGAVHACVQASSGIVKIVGANDGCPQHHYALDWSIVGPAGPAGPAGPTGPTGPAGPTGSAGPAGADGVSGYEIITACSPADCSDDIADTKALIAHCPPGKVPVGGGASTDVLPIAVINYSNIEPPDGWLARAFESPPDSITAWHLEVSVICTNA